MKKNYLKKSKSFTLVEMLIAVSIFAVVVMISLATLTATNKTHANTDVQGTTQRESRFALMMMTNEVKVADVRGAVCVNPPACTSNIFYYGFAIVDNVGKPITVPSNSEASGSRLKIVHYDAANTQNIMRVYELYDANAGSTVASCAAGGTNDCYIRVYNDLSKQWSRVTSPDIRVLSLSFTGVHHIDPSDGYYNKISPFVTISMTTESKSANTAGKKETISLQTTVAGAKDSNMKSGLFTWIGPQNGNIYKLQLGSQPPFQLGDTIYYSYDLGYTQCGGWPTSIPWTSQCQVTQFPPVISDKSYLASMGQNLYATIEPNANYSVSLAKFDAYSGQLKASVSYPGSPRGLATAGNNLYLWWSDGNLYLINPSTLARTAVTGTGAVWPGGAPSAYSQMTSDGKYIFQAATVAGSTMVRKLYPIISGGVPVLGGPVTIATVPGVSPLGLAHLNHNVYLWQSNGTVAKLDENNLNVVTASILSSTWLSSAIGSTYMISDGRYLYLAKPVVGGPVGWETQIARIDLQGPTIQFGPSGTPTPILGKPQGLAVIRQEEY